MFISHSSHEPRSLGFRDEVVRELENDGFAPWLDARKLEYGQDWLNAIFRGIAESDATVVLLSKNARSGSPVCAIEITAAQFIRQCLGDSYPLIVVVVDPETLAPTPGQRRGQDVIGALRLEQMHCIKKGEAGEAAREVRRALRTRFDKVPDRPTVAEQQARAWARNNLRRIPERPLGAILGSVGTGCGCAFGPSNRPLEYLARGLIDAAADVRVPSQQRALTMCCVVSRAQELLLDEDRTARTPSWMSGPFATERDAVRERGAALLDLVDTVLPQHVEPALAQGFLAALIDHRSLGRVSRLPVSRQFSVDLVVSRATNRPRSRVPLYCYLRQTTLPFRDAEDPADVLAGELAYHLIAALSILDYDVPLAPWSALEVEVRRDLPIRLGERTRHFPFIFAFSEALSATVTPRMLVDVRRLTGLHELAFVLTGVDEAADGEGECDVLELPDDFEPTMTALNDAKRSLENEIAEFHANL